MTSKYSFWSGTKIELSFAQQFSFGFEQSLFISLTRIFQEPGSCREKTSGYDGRTIHITSVLKTLLNAGNSSRSQELDYQDILAERDFEDPIAFLANAIIQRAMDP